MGWLRRISLDQWRAIDADARTPSEERADPHITTLVVLVTCAVVLTLQEYYGGSDRYAVYFAAPDGDYLALSGFAWWTGWRVAGYVAVPLLVIACLPGQRLRDYNVSLRGFFKHAWIYGALFLAILPAVFLASRTESFRNTYPFYRLANRSYGDLFAWEALYAAQFVALEFFFRGFLLQGLRRALGANAIFVMIVPYCMIHFSKPISETLGAVGAGLILGTLAMRTRSIWGGVLVHVGVAITMDVLALAGCPPMGSKHPCYPP